MIRIGKSYSIRGAHSSTSVRSDVVEIDLDVDKLAREPARALADAVGAGIRGISQTAKDGHQLFNVTGRLGRGIVPVAASAGVYRILPPADRLNDRGMVARLRTAVSSNLEADPGVRAAIEKSITKAIKVRRG